jgi:hypothetical protein
MVKAKSAVLFVLLVLGLVFLPQSFHLQAEVAAGGLTVRIDPQQTPGIDFNDNFTIYVVVDNAVGVEAAQVQFTYDPTIVNATQVVEGPFLPSVGATAAAQVMAKAGEVFYSSALTTGATASGSGVLLNVTFNVISGGGVQFHLLPYKAGSGKDGTYFVDINFAEMIPSIAGGDGYYGSPIKISAKPDVADIGQNVTLTGTLSGPALATVHSVSIQYNTEGGAWVALASVPTNGSGFFTYQWTGNETADVEFQVYFTLEGRIFYSPTILVTVGNFSYSLIGYVYDAIIVLIIIIVAVAVVTFIRGRLRHEDLPTEP